MKRRRISPVMIAGIVAILAALGLIYLISTGGVFIQIDPTAQQQTVEAMEPNRLTQTAENRQREATAVNATQAAVTQISPMILPGQNTPTESPAAGS
jgi:hypothetical protein